MFGLAGRRSNFRPSPLSTIIYLLACLHTCRCLGVVAPRPLALSPPIICTSQELRLKLEEYERVRSTGVLSMVYDMDQAAQDEKVDFNEQGFFMDHDFDRYR